MEQVPGSVEKSKYAPVNSNQQYGLISYEGTMGREDAYKKMHKTCNGKYKIIDEYKSSAGGVYVPYGQYSQYGGTMLNAEKTNIKFLCVE